MRGTRYGALSMLALLLVTACAAFARTWRVGHSGLADFPALSDAIARAAPGDSIIILAGTYVENIVLKDSLTLIGENAEQTRITNGQGLPIVVCRSRAGVNLVSLTFRWNKNVLGKAPALWFRNARQVRIDRCTIESAEGHGVEIDNSKVRIANSRISLCSGSGIYAYGGSEIDVERCIITDNKRQGIAAEGSTQVAIVNNTIVRNGGGGVWVQGGCSGQIYNNIFAENEFGIAIGADCKNIESNYNCYWKNRLGDYRKVSAEPNEKGNFVSETVGDAFASDGDIHLDPEFVASKIGDFRLRATTPLLNKGRGNQTLGACVVISVAGQDVLPPEIRLLDEKSQISVHVGDKVKVVPFSRGLSVVGDSAFLVIRGVAKDESGIVEVSAEGRKASMKELRGGAIFSLKIPLKSGQNTITIKAVDQYANVGEETFTVQLTGNVGARIRALVVGINNYLNTRLSLKYATPDARLFYQALAGPTVGIPADQITLLVDADATRSAIVAKILDIGKQTREEDLAVVYFALHGVPSSYTDRLYLLPYDADPSNVDGTGLGMSDVVDNLRRTARGKVLLIFDACHANGADVYQLVYNVGTTRDLVAQRTNQLLVGKIGHVKSGLGLLAAAQGSEVSYEGPQWGGGHGVFTYYLVEALTRGEADMDHDGLITLKEVYDYVYRKVSADTGHKQTPAFTGNLDMSIPLATVH